DGVGVRSGSGLDTGQQLLALHDAVVASIDDLEVNAQSARGVLGSGGLLNLVIVVVVGQREQEAQLFHTRGCFWRNHTLMLPRGMTRPLVTHDGGNRLCERGP